MLTKIALDTAQQAIARPWLPMILGELNGQYVKLARFVGEYVWHHHEAEDELFMVISGRVRIDLRPKDGGAIELGPGELLIVPRGTEHKPQALDDALVLLFEPASTRSTGNVDHHYSLEPEQLPRL
jgi:mannose-6-phosphate isomerase-like protein (cupin superfamily)